MFNTDSYGIPDIESTLAFDEYPGNLKSFQVRIAQAIYWYRANKIFISESQVKYLQELNYLYKCIWLENLTIPWKNTLKIADNGKFLSEDILNQYSAQELKNILEWNSLEPYIHTSNIDKISRLSWAWATRKSPSVEKINNKWNAQTELRTLWVCVPDGKVVFSQEEAKKQFSNLKEKWYENIWFKLHNSINWLWVFKVNGWWELNKLLEKHSSVLLNEWILIDGWIENKIASPNIQFYVWKTQKEDQLITVSDQILLDWWVEHIWNISDVSILQKDLFLQKDLKIILDWIRDKWWYWVVWIDFLTYLEWDEIKNAFIEINWRYNGSTHWQVISNKLGQNHWISHDWIHVPSKNLNTFMVELEKNNILYNKDSNIWVIPVNPSVLQYWKSSVVIVWDSQEKVLEILNNL